MAVKKGNIPWNKNVIGQQVAWNKGLTKLDDSRIKGPTKYSNITSPFEKVCPTCNSIMEYKDKYSLVYSIRDNKKCNSCAISENNIGKSRKGIIRTDEWRKNLRLATIGRIKKLYSEHGEDIVVFPNFNPNACKLIEQYGKENGYNFQHALNGGEHHIKELCYWVDGYDKEKNVVIEIDESHHFDSCGKLRECDIRRQTEIENFLNCKFIRLTI